VLLSLAGASPWEVSGPDRVDVTVRRWISLSGPEGGLTNEEEALAQRHGFRAISLGPRVLRADTAPLALLAQLAWLHDRPNQGHE
jgi:16S rRNA (uracil1498-N3)-methyltransferase